MSLLRHNFSRECLMTAFWNFWIYFQDHNLQISSWLESKLSYVVGGCWVILINFQQTMCDQCGWFSMTKLLEKSHNPEPLVTDTSCEPSDANTVWQIIQLSFSFHNIKTFSSPCIFQQIQYMSPQASTRTEECAKSHWGKAKSSPCATPLPHVYLCQ